MLRSYFGDYSHWYSVIKRAITVKSTNVDKKRSKKLLKNNATFLSCLSKINNAFVDIAKDMPIYKLFEYSDSYSMTSTSFWNFIEMK